MIDLEKRLGPFNFRVWGLIINFIGNGLLLYGAANYINGIHGPSLMVVGTIITFVCILILAIPQK